MKKSKFTFIIIFITATILATISLQVYWNLKNYDENKTRVINEVQISYNNAPTKYYASVSKKTHQLLTPINKTKN